MRIPPFGGRIMKDEEKSGIERGAEVADRPGYTGHSAAEAAAADAVLEQVLPESYRSCLDAIPDLIALKGEGLEYLFVNRAFCDVLDKEQDEILGRRAIDIFPGDVARKLETMDLLVLASVDKSVEEVIIDGRIYEIRKFPVSLRDRGLVVVSGRDITERRESEETLLTEKIRFQIISDNAPLAMALFDGQGSVKYVNVKFRDIFGYEVDGIRDGARWFRRVFPEREYETEVLSVIRRPDDVEGWKGRERHILTAICRNGARRIISFEAVQLASRDVVVSCDDMGEGMAEEGRAVFEADHDALTSLPNRSSLERAVRNIVDRAREGKKRKSRSVLLLLAIQDFPGLLRSYGTGGGDEILITFAKLLTSILRTGDAAYRSDGDQFAVVFEGISLTEARLAAERIQKTMRGFTFLPGSGNVLLDVAVALVQVDGKEGVDQILVIGEKMMGKAKTSGRHRILVHEPAGG
jgi:diguanylate cyclase (GGDEF)-like protein/PAS domain S-box-containing protein